MNALTLQVPRVLAAALLLTLSSCMTTTLTNTPDNPPTDTPPASTEYGTVTAVIDGDTIDVHTEGTTQRVRIIGIDTPEINRAGGTHDCYAEEARDLLNTLVYQQEVTLEADPTQANTDRYDRLLRHVTVDDTNVALYLLQAGAAREYTYDEPYQGQSAYRAAEYEAAATNAGLWANCK